MEDDKDKESKCMRRIIACLLLCLLFSLTACTRNKEGSSSGYTSENYMEATSKFFAMDTYITFTAYGKDAEQILNSAQKKVNELESLWSVTDTNSEIYAVNHSAGNYVTLSQETTDLVSFALEMADKTSGALEPTIYPILTAWGFTTDKNHVPSEDEIAKLMQYIGHDKVILSGSQIQIEDGMQLDLGAVGKGYAGDLVVELLKENGITSALLDIGGNIQTVGAKPDGSSWRIGIKDPLEDSNMGMLDIVDKAVITSGGYERYFTSEDGKKYGHIIDPLTGYPAESGLISATIIASEGKVGDALSTSIYVMGVEKATEYWRDNKNFDMILITDDEEIYVTEDIEKQFALSNSHSEMKVNVITDEEN